MKFFSIIITTVLLMSCSSMGTSGSSSPRSIDSMDPLERNHPINSQDPYFG